MQILIEIQDSDIPKGQDIISIPIHFIDGEVCDAGGHGFCIIPKGHGRLIDADAITKDLNTFQDAFAINIANGRIIGIACSAPTIIEADDLEVWNGIHAQITAPKGTFEKIWNEADKGDKDEY